jgi:uncharacterized protein
MKIALDTASNVNVVKAYEPGEVQIRDKHYRRSLIVLPNWLMNDWVPDSVTQLRSVHFNPVLEHRPELLILGTGETQVFPEPATFMTLMDLGIGCEVMDNAAACRTYNILLSEDRRVALALILAGQAS